MKLGSLLGCCLLLSACFTDTSYERLKISSTTWIGYAPLFYAKEKKWLDDYNIKLTQVVSLSENMYLYEAGNSDAYVGTQYEYRILSKKIPGLKPVVLFDRSNGGDMILANQSIQTIKQAEEIEAYLELDSVNAVLLQDFIAKHQIHAHINYYNKDQAEISVLKTHPDQATTVVVSYDPYHYRLQKNGFQEIASTADITDLLVVDALFTSQETLQKHQVQFEALKKMVDEALIALNRDPQAFYQTIKPHLRHLRYEDFLNSLTKIEWLSSPISEELVQRIQASGLPMDGLL